MYKYPITLLLLFWFSPAYSQDLLDIYDLAWQHDPAIQEVEANRDAVLEARPQSLARLLPSLSIVGALNANRYDTANTYTRLQFGTQHFWDSNVYLKLAQPIYHHDYWLQLSQTDNQIAQAEAEYASEQQNLLMKTAKAYFAVLAAQSNLDFAAMEKRSLEYQLKQMTQRHAVGTASIIDQQEAQAGFDQVNAGEIDAQRKLQAAKSALAEIIGTADFELNLLREDLPLETPIPNNIDDWLALAQQNNFSILAATNQAELTRKNIEIQFAGHLPTLDLVGNFGIADTDRPAGLVANSQTVGIQLNMPVFQGGGVDSKVRQARHQFEAAQHKVDKQRRAAEKQVKDAYQGIEFTISQTQALNSAQKSSRVAVEAAEKGLAVGTRTMAELLTANRNWSRMQRDYTQARFDYVLNGLILKQAAGSLSRADLETINSWLH